MVEVDGLVPDPQFVTLAAGKHPVWLDVLGLPARTYLVRLTAGGTAAVRPLTIVR